MLRESHRVGDEAAGLWRRAGGPGTPTTSMPTPSIPGSSFCTAAGGSCMSSLGSRSQPGSGHPLPGCPLSPFPPASFTFQLPFWLLAGPRNEPPGLEQTLHTCSCRRLHPWLPPLCATGPGDDGDKSWQCPCSMCAALAAHPSCQQALVWSTSSFPRGAGVWAGSSYLRSWLWNGREIPRPRQAAAAAETL